MLRHKLVFLIAALLITMSGPAVGQDEYSQHWNGEWVADGSLFKIDVSVENNVMRVRQIESLGFEWSSQDGKIDGNIVRVEIQYAGVTGTIQAELIDANTAIAFAETCLPEFMVVCALAKNRQAIFRKVQSN